MYTRLRGEFLETGVIIQTVYIAKQKLFIAVAGKSASAYNVPKQRRRSVVQRKGYVLSLTVTGLKRLEKMH